MEVQKKNFSSEIDTECLNTPTQSERSYNTNSNFDSFEESDSFEDSDYEDYYNNNLVGINDNYTDLYEKINEENEIKIYT